MNKEFKIPAKSYWLASTPKTNYPTLEEDISVDIAIVGGGLVGISCGYLLQNQGYKIAILEADRVCQGTTAHTTAKITSQHGLIYNQLKNKVGEETAKLYAESNELAISEIGKIIVDNGIDCEYISQSAYVYTQTDRYLSKIEEEVKLAQSLGIQASFVENIPFNMDIKGAVRFNNQAQFHPRKYLLGLANLLSGDVSIYENTRAVRLEEEKDLTIITENKKNIKAKKIIIASQYPFYNKKGLYFSRLFPKRSYVVGIKAKEKYPGGMYINAEQPTRSLRHQSTEDGELILVVGADHITGQQDITNKNYDELIKFANELFTVENIPYRWSTQDPMTLDEIPYIGHLTSNTENIYVATGFNQWGMTSSYVSAMVLKDLIVKEDSPYKDLYNPSRKNIRASAKNLVSKNLNIAAYLLNGKITPADKDYQIEKGQGKTIKIEGEKVGAYRDEEGNLHLINTTCPHMGCELKWNSAESSWDCPCHGSRFTYTGEIIEGPAVKPLLAGNNVNTIEKLFKDDF